MHIPSPVSQKFNFIFLHYVYLFSLAIVGSILIYPVKNIPYIDALVFASGAATQSGLNTVDLNLLTTYQQIVLYIIPWIANPIFINGAVVFIRLYWFRKRFEHIVQQSRLNRSSRTRSMARSMNADVEREPRSVAGRTITVLHREPPADLNELLRKGQPKPDANLPPYNTPPPSQATTPRPGSLRNSLDGSVSPTSRLPRLQTAITWDTSTKVGDRSANPTASSSTYASTPTVGSSEDFHRDGNASPSPTAPANGPSEGVNVQFLDVPHPKYMQQNPTQTSSSLALDYVSKQRQVASERHGTLRIPSPREYERGGKPIDLDENAKDDEESEEPHTLRRIKTTGALSLDGTGKDEITSLPGTRLPQARPFTIDHPNPSSRTAPESQLRQRLHGNKFLPRSMTLEHAINRIRGRSESPMSRMSRKQETEFKPYLSYAPTIGRNSAFVDLTDEQRDELGGVEYRSLKVLAKVLIGYYLGFHLFGVICFLPFIHAKSYYGKIVDNVGVSKTWWAIWTSSMSFLDVGFSLTPDSMVSFQSNAFILLIGAFLIIIGNTAFPCLLRFIIWVLHKITPEDSSVKESLHFLLDHPRRCFTLMFPAGATWALFGILVLLNAADTILFVALDWNNEELAKIPNGTKILDGVYQAASTRTAGFSVVNLAKLAPAVQVSYMIMMYISIFPIAISVRRTNVYEEKALGIYPTEEEVDDAEPSYIGAHLRRQLSFDLWYIALGLFIICIAEGKKLANEKLTDFNIFAVLFEVVSAYGTVGLSFGYGGYNTSFVGQFSVVGKLVIIAMQMRGRHRGLPYELDRAILLPSESLHLKEEEDARNRLRRRMSNLSRMTHDRTETEDLRPLTATSRSFTTSRSMRKDATSF
ncbi:hypothetical protein BJ508DRAFT_322019 [Ascobolus immersus RN42]|uniref:Potassium transport protein n=1 Tax=Ascobolus immersus RN42 TaxID=1160509 RepID=A0A3N4IQ47_ASCIM|nr:hypothetical protein BJ508DRAFT_322019 [Ascobolus immersus RN42]